MSAETTVPHRTSDATATPAAPGRTPFQGRRILDDIPAYVPGKPATDPDVFKVSSNESPYPLPASVAEAISASIATIGRYPDLGVTAPREALAAHLGVDVENVGVAAGSVGVLGQLLDALCEEGDEVVYPWRSFEAYPIAIGVAGGRGVPVPLTSDHRHDLSAMAAAVTDRTRVVLVCSPNNPSGTTVSQAELDAFLDAVPDTVLVILDEAYREFVDPAEAEHFDGLATFRARPNVAVLRTFSKVQGLAGLRIGYGLMPADALVAMAKVAPAFGVSAPAQAAAVASLQPEAIAEFERRTGHLVAERKRVEQGLEEMGWEFGGEGLPRSQGNFVFFPFEESEGAAFTAFCAERGLIIRHYGNDGARATIAEDAANDRLLAIAEEWLRR